MNQMTQFLVDHAASALFLAIFAEQIGMLFPAAPVLVTAGALAADNVLNPGMAITVTVAGSVLADFIWFYLGRRSGGKVLGILSRFFLSDSSKVDQTGRLFAKYGMSALTAGKFIPGLSLLMPPLAGAFRVGLGKFLFYDAIGSLMYSLFYLGLGYVFKSEVNSVLEFLGHAGLHTIGAFLALVLGFLAWKYLRRRKAIKAEYEDRSTALAVARQA